MFRHCQERSPGGYTQKRKPYLKFEDVNFKQIDFLDCKLFKDCHKSVPYVKVLETFVNTHTPRPEKPKHHKPNHLTKKVLHINPEYVMLDECETFLETEEFLAVLDIYRNAWPPIHRLKDLKLEILERGEERFPAFKHSLNDIKHLLDGFEVVVLYNL
jgi:hypothetical protein